MAISDSLVLARGWPDHISERDQGLRMGGIFFPSANTQLLPLGH